MQPGTEEDHRKEALPRARRLPEGERKQCPEVEEDPEGERRSKWRGLRRGRGGQMRFIVGVGDVGEQQGGEGSQAREEEGQEPGQEANGPVHSEEDGEGVEEGAAEEVGQKNAAADRVGERDGLGWTGEGKERDDSGQRREEVEQEPRERQQQEESGESGTGRNTWAGTNRERCEKG